MITASDVSNRKQPILHSEGAKEAFCRQLKSQEYLLTKLQFRVSRKLGKAN